MNLLTQNSKLKKTSKHFNKRVFNFGLPAYKSSTGKVVCRMADQCIKFCYAKKGAYIWSNVSPAFEKRLQISMQDNFVDLMVAEIKKKKVDYVRVHDSGDYYDKRYLAKWFKIAELLPNVRFYSYTNEVGMIKNLESIPKNYDFIFSDSGKQKDLINKKASEVMTKNPKVVKEDTLVGEALNIMNSKKITILCVQQKNKKNNNEKFFYKSSLILPLKIPNNCKAN